MISDQSNATGIMSDQRPADTAHSKTAFQDPCAKKQETRNSITIEPSHICKYCNAPPVEFQQREDDHRQDQRSLKARPTELANWPLWGSNPRCRLHGIIQNKI